MEYQADGSFWIDDPAEAVRGRLSFTQADGGELRLEAILARPGDLMASVELIHGQALDGTELCLMNTFPTRLQISTPAMPVYPHRFFVNRLLVGAGQPELPIQEARIALHRLLDFTDYSGLSVTASGTARHEPISVGWEPPDDRASAAVDGIEVSIATERVFKGEDYEFSIEHRAEIELRDAAGRAIADWSKPAFWIEGLISFLLGSPTWIERFYAPRDTGEIDYIFQRRDAAVPRSQRKPWLTLPVIRERFEQVVAGWFAFEHSDREAFLILNEYVRSSGRLLAEDRLLYLARVIELYHRGASRFAQVVIPKDEQRKRVRAVLDAAPDEHADWLQNVLSRSNEKTLRERITDLVESFDEALTPIVGDGAEEFAATVTDNRNYFTHYSLHLRDRGRVLHGIELRQLTQRLLMVVRACILREMKFSNGEIRALLERDREYAALSG